MRKSNAEIYDEISSVRVTTMNGEFVNRRFDASIEFYDTCRLALHYENKGWIRRAMNIWQVIRRLNDNECCQQYAINGMDRCNRALIKLAGVKARKEMA